LVGGFIGFVGHFHRFVGDFPGLVGHFSDFVGKPFIGRVPLFGIGSFFFHENKT